MMGNGNDYYNMMGYGLGWIMMIGFWLVIGIGILALARYVIHLNHKQAKNVFSNSSAINILNERYAKGEIDITEYQKVKNEISSKKFE